MLLRPSGVFLLLLLTTAGCEAPDSAPPSNTVTDALDRTVQIETPVQRVVSLAPNLTELVYAAGAGSTLVAATSSADYPPATDTLDHVSALPIDFEAITAKNPDLVLATDQINPPGDTETFEALDVPIYFFSFSSLDDVFEALRTMGALLNTASTARARAQAFESQLEALRTRTDSLARSERPRVLVLIGDDTLYSFGEGSYVHELVAAAGGKSITASIETDAPTLSEEYVLTEKPDVIVGAWGPDYDPNRLLDLHPSWDIVPALQNNRVYSLPPELLLRPGPRLVQGARQLATHLHPDRFEARAVPTDGTASPLPLLPPVAQPSADQ